MSLIKKIAWNNLLVLSERLFTAFLGFLISIWLIRYLGPERYGIYSLVFAWFTFLNVFTPFAIEQVVARESVRHPEQMRKYLGAGVSIKILLAILGWICGILITWLLDYPRTVIFYLAIVLFGLVGNASYVLQVPHQIELKLLYPALAEGGSNFLYQIARGILILLECGLYPFFLAHLVWRIFQLGLFFLLGIEKSSYRPSFKFGLQEVRHIFYASWVLLVNNIFVMLISKIDQLMLYPSWGEKYLGWYGSCARLIDYLVIIASVWYITAFPLLSRYLGESRSAYEKASFYSFKYLSLASCFIWLIFAGFSKDVLQLLFGSEYLPAQSALFWLSTALVFIFLQVSFFNLALSQNLEKKWLLINGTGALANISLNLLLIPDYGITGAGIATFGAFFVQIILCGLLREFRPGFLIMLKAGAVPIILSLFLILAVNYFQLSLFPWGVIITGLFLLLLVIFKTLNKNDLIFIKKAFLPEK